MKLKVIYEPKGRALEYAELALNIYKGCTFGCTYCSVPGFMNITREDFQSNVLERENFLSNVERDCKLLSGTTKRVLLCFITDPYNDREHEHQLTRRVLELFNKYNIPFEVLTKGGSRAKRDFDLYRKGDAFATTLTFLDSERGMEWEPYAMDAADRIQTIKAAHARGIETWVSLEPVLDPDEVYAIIEATHAYVDLFKVGKLNHHPLADTIDWYTFAKRVVAKLESYGSKYYIKNDLKPYLD